MRDYTVLFLTYSKFECEFYWSLTTTTDAEEHLHPVSYRFKVIAAYCSNVTHIIFVSKLHYSAFLLVANSAYIEVNKALSVPLRGL